MTDEIEITTLRTPVQFMQEIEELVTQKGMDYIDAVMHYCQANNLEVETAAELIKGSMKMKAKIQNEAETLGYLPKSAKLPLD